MKRRRGRSLLEDDDLHVLGREESSGGDVCERCGCTRDKHTEEDGCTKCGRCEQFMEFDST